MVFETPITEERGSFSDPWYKYIPRNVNIYAPIGIVIEVSGKPVNTVSILNHMQAIQ